MAGAAPGAPGAVVRPATAADVPAIAAVQARSWRQAYPTLLPGAVLERLTDQALVPAWEAAVTHPPSPRHLVVVACAEAIVVGFAAVAPSGDRDAGPADGELVELAVHPLHQHAGHGSRLLAAATDTLREHGAATVRAWVPEPDTARLAFLASAGLAPDGAARTLAAPGGRQVRQLRVTARL